MEVILIQTLKKGCAIRNHPAIGTAHFVEFSMQPLWRDRPCANILFAG